MNSNDALESNDAQERPAKQEENTHDDDQKNFNKLANYPSFQRLEYTDQKVLVDKITELFKKGSDERWLVSEDEIKIGKKIGEGSNSVIHDCQWRGLNIVVKMTKTNKLDLLNVLLKEIDVWSGLRHPNLVQFLGFSYSFKNHEFMILMEKIDGVNLRVLVERKMSNISNHQKYHICMQLINVIKFLHSCKPAVIYRDLKPENIMIDKFYNVKLTDFGLSRFMPETEPYKMTGTTGTIRYMAPEVYFGQYYDLSADVYSLGLIIYYVFSGSRPFLDYNTQTIGTYFTNPDLLFSTKLVKERKIRSIINNCIEKDYRERWDINALWSSFMDAMCGGNQNGCMLS